MRLTNKILYGQTSLDMAIQELDDVERLFEIAIDNDISITDDLVPGTQLLVGDPDKSVRNIVQLFSDPANAPASADEEQLVNSRLEGIGYWKIENDFIVQ